MNDPYPVPGPPASEAISPKVVAPAIFNIILIVVTATIASLNPAFFAGLGQWGPVVFIAVSTLGSALTGYVKKDPLR